MATSKSSSSAASKSAAGKKSSAPSKSSGASTSASRGGSSTKNSTASKAAVKGAIKPAVKSASKVAVKSAGSTASKSAASGGSGAGKATAARGATKPAAATKAPAGGASAARGGNTASRNTSARASSSRASKSTATAGDPRNDLEKILQDLMKDIYYAEKKLGKALGKMAKNATNPKLKEAFTTHQAQTEDQVSKLEDAFGLLGLTPKAVKCAAMDGLLEEANEHIEEYKKGAGLDAALIVGAQKVEHYEIAAYGSMRSFAATLGYDEAASIFEEIREQESDTDELLTTLAESIINLKAEGETEDVSDSAKSGAGSGDGDSKAGEDSSSADSGGQGGEGGDNASSSNAEGGAISGMTDGNNREGASETGEAMGY